MGLKAEKVTPDGTEPVTDNVTGPLNPSWEVPFTLKVPDAPCATEIAAEEGAIVKSAVVT